MNANEFVTIRVYGEPAPQGSKKFMGISKGGHGILKESSDKVRPWRDAVVRDALHDVGSPMLDGPLVVDLIFYLPRGTSIPKRRTTPWKKPDLSKIVRSTEDALTDAGVWHDDAQIVSCFANKQYAVMTPPGAVITIKQGVTDESTQAAG